MSIPHMTPDEFRQHGRETVEWIATYMEQVEDLPVASQVEPGWVREQLPEHPPGSGETFSELLADLDRVVLPATTHWQHPNFHAYFNGNASGPSILGDLIASGLATQGMLWSTGPAATEIETHVLDWLVEMLGLPQSFLSTGAGGGVIQDSASSATLVSLLAARERATDGRSNREGATGSLVAYCSDQAHSSIEKGVRIAGIGSDKLRSIPTDSEFKLRPEELAKAIEADLVAGYVPFWVCATVGSTSSTAIDPVPAIAEISSEHGLWLHVDAALAGTAALVPEVRWIHDGVGSADSYVFNPHKWMLTNFDCSAFFVANRAHLQRALSVLPEYLRNESSESGRVIDYRDWQISLGRRFRALKLWFVIRWYGVDGLREFVEEHLRLAQLFAGWVEDHPDFELAAPVHLNLVCFRDRRGDVTNRQIMDKANTSGEIFITHTRLDGKLTLRMSIGQTHTEERHVIKAWDVILRSR